MSPLAVFIRTLLKSSAICLGIAIAILQPSLTNSSGTNSAGALQSASETAVDALVGALKDSDAGVRRHAAGALAQIGNTRAVPGLMEAARDTTPDVRLKVIAALGELADKRAIPTLTSALKDEDPRVRAR